MESFIFIGDYIKQIQKENLYQIIGGNLATLESIQQAAVEECASYLKVKYDVSKALQKTVKHDKSASYLAGQTVYLDAPAYDSKVTYPTVGTLRVFEENVYKSTVAITTAEPFESSKWSSIGEQYALYNAKLPELPFDYKKYYSAGDKVFYKGKTYTALKDTQYLDHQSQLNMGIAGIDPIVNVFPDDPIKGVQYWGVGVAYSIPANTEITNTTYWEQGDARDQKLLQICIDICLYHAHSRIAPQNIPMLRVKRYMGDDADRETRGQRILYPTYCALGWLQAAVIGNDITPNMPIIQPEQGKRIRFGGNFKNINSY